MRDDELRKYAGIMEEFGLTGLEFDDSGEIRRIERNPLSGRNLLQAMGASITADAAPAADAGLNSAISGNVTESAKSAQGGKVKEIKSPMVGMFYDCPTEDEPPFVQVGDTVKKGDVLCIIEAMKLMNEITSDYDGVIEEICIGNKAAVEYGTVLYRIREE